MRKLLLIRVPGCMDEYFYFCSRPHVHSRFDYVLMRMMRCACFQVILMCSTYQLSVDNHDRTCRWPGHKARYRHMALSALGPFPFRCDRHDGKRGKVKVKGNHVCKIHVNEIFMVLVKMPW